MATRAKTPPSKAAKSKKTAAPKPKRSATGSEREKTAKPVSKTTPAKKSTSKLPKNIKSKKTTEAVEPEVVIEDTATLTTLRTAGKKTVAKAVPVVEEVQEPKPAKRGRKPKATDTADDEIIPLEKPVERDARKSLRERSVLDDDDDLDADEDDDDDEEEGDDDDRPARSKKRDGKKAMRGRKRSATEEFLEEDMEETEEVEDVEILDDLDPFASTLILDPELAGPPPAPPAQLPPRPKRLAPRMQVCADCGQQFGWLSIEKVCFNCLKKRVAQRKKDEDYSGYGGSDDSGGDDDY